MQWRVPVIDCLLSAVVLSRTTRVELDSSKPAQFLALARLNLHSNPCRRLSLSLRVTLVLLHGIRAFPLV